MCSSIGLALALTRVLGRFVRNVQGTSTSDSFSDEEKKSVLTLTPGLCLALEQLGPEV
jgi:hypothetical protein